MKKLIIFLILAMFFVISCNSSKKAENDADILPDEDEINDEESVEPDEDENDEEAGELNDTDKDAIENMDPCDPNPCENFANTDGTCSVKEDGSFECGCVEGYFWGHSGCKKITFANICTGQEKCYDIYSNTPEQKCPPEYSVWYGQDARYAEMGYCLKKDFKVDRSVENEPTHINSDIRLEWMRYDTDSYSTWEEALNYCNYLEYAGHDDWRLPMPKELMLIVKDLHSISNSSQLFWSSLSLPENSSLAWYLNKMLYIDSAGKTSRFSVRCTRGDSSPFVESKPESGRFRIINLNGREMISDSVSGILWQNSYSKEYEWTDALVYCERSDYAGFSDWRMPNLYELTSLINYQYERLAEFPLTETISSEYNTGFWSSTTNPFPEDPTAYGMDLKTGLNINLHKSQKRAHTLCLRNDPCREGYWWNGENCVKNPCEDNPCKGMKNSDGTCGTEDFKSYFCGCDEGWFWDGRQCAANPCEPDPCGNYENSTGNCRADNSLTFICGCDEGYWWWGREKGCLNERPHQARVCTGQTKCYDMEKEIDCPAEGEEFYGQDAQYAASGKCVPQNFIIDDAYDDEPIVIDLITGLEWQQKVRPAEILSLNDADIYCYSLDYGGYHDWRLPTNYELQTLITLDTSPTVNPKYFPDTPPENFWTSSTSPAGYYDMVTILNFENADPSEMVATDIFEGGYSKLMSTVRCVRGDVFEEEYGSAYGVSYEGGNLYTDTTSNLIWHTVNLDYNKYGDLWPERLQYCENLVFAGFSDWRLPNIRELNLITTTTSYKYYGSSSTTMPWHPAEHFGSLSYKDEESYSYACVRENPCMKGKIWDHGECQ